MTATLRPSLTAVSAALMAAAVLGGPWWTGAVVLAYIFFTAMGWDNLVNLPRSRASAILMALIGGLALGTQIRGEPDLLTGLLAVGTITTFVFQMLRRDGRPRLVERVSADIAAIAVFVSAAAWMDLARLAHRPGALHTAAVVAAGFFCSTLVSYFSRSALILGVVAPILGALAGGVVGHITGTPGIWFGALLGTITGVAEAATAGAFARMPRRGEASVMIASALTPVLVLGFPIAMIGMFLLR